MAKSEFGEEQVYTNSSCSPTLFSVETETCVLPCLVHHLLPLPPANSANTIAHRMLFIRDRMQFLTIQSLSLEITVTTFSHTVSLKLLPFPFSVSLEMDKYYLQNKQATHIGIL